MNRIQIKDSGERLTLLARSMDKFDIDEIRDDGQDVYKRQDLSERRRCGRSR